jgi:predicted amidohydrolase YtcJ
MTDLLITGARLVPVAGVAAPEHPVDVLVSGGRVADVGPKLASRGVADVIAAQGRWLLPGLWDAHVHPVMWALARARIDLSGTTDPTDVCRRVAAHLSARPGEQLVLGYGYRSAAWDRLPTVLELDAATGSRPVALASGDAHNGWLNSAALALIGQAPREGALVEGEWYAAYRHLEAIATSLEEPEAALEAALAAAAARGVVGIVDFEFDSAWRTWPARLERGRPPVRIRAAAYADSLDDVAAAGLRTGDPLVAGEDLLTMGPLKVISDGSLNTLTAWCCEPYAPDGGDDGGCGRSNLTAAELREVMSRAGDIGLTCAIHAIGDRAVATALDAFSATRQSGSIEHAQLVGAADFERLAALGLTASVQPVHLIDDRLVTDRYWRDRADRVYAFRSLLDAGVALAFGSDAPVAPLDPWCAIAAAVFRADAADEPWHSEQAITPAEALASSTDGQGTVQIGQPADLVLVDADPLALGSLADRSATADGSPPAQADRAHLRELPVALTLVGGRRTHEALT